MKSVRAYTIKKGYFNILSQYVDHGLATGKPLLASTLQSFLHPFSIQLTNQLDELSEGEHRDIVEAQRAEVGIFLHLLKSHYTTNQIVEHRDTLHDLLQRELPFS